MPTEGGEDVRDPILFFTSYGYTNCGIISGVNNALWLNMGWQARYDQLGDHTVSECSWDGGKTWHMFDDSMSFYCFNDKGAVASTPEIKAHPEYYLRNFAPECGTNPVKDEHDSQGWRQASDHPVDFQRTLANGVQSFLGNPELNTDHLAIQWGRTFAISLRPRESYTRLFTRLEGPGTFRPLHDQDVEAGELRGCIRANGVWRYSPDLTDPSTSLLVDSSSAAVWTPGGVAGPGVVMFKVDAANVVTAAVLTLTGTGTYTISVARAPGGPFREVKGNGRLFRFPPPVAGVTEYRVAVAIGADSVLQALTIETTTQINRPSLPRLVRGPNRVRLRLGRQVETLTLAPSLVETSWFDGAYAADRVAVNPKPYFNVATIAPAVSGTPCSATWKIGSPLPIVDIEYGGNVCVKAWDGNAGWAALQHSWDGVTFTEDYRKADAALPFDLVQRVSAGPVPPETRFAWLRYAFATSGDPRKLWQSPGFGSVLALVHQRPRVTGFTPIEVTYDWVEHLPHREVEHRHTEIVTKPDHEYTINVGGIRDPEMRWVRMALASSESPPAGYADGHPGPRAEPAERAVYHWGANLALGRSYSLTGDQDTRNPDGGHDLTDGIVAPPETYVSAKWMPTNVIFKPGSTPVVTLDLGSVQKVAAVVVHAGQGGDEHVTFPESILVMASRDGKGYTPGGLAEFDQVWDPPADFAPWELENAAAFRDLPAGGRLAFAYRILFPKPVTARFLQVTCTPLSGWGTMLSELQAFASVTVDRDVPPAVVLPPLEK